MPRRIPPEAAVLSSPLFILSPEIRNMIYALLLTTSKQISFKEYPRYSARAITILRRKTLEDGGKDLFPSILLTCRLIYQEACPLLYRGNAFYFYEPATSDSFRWHTGSKYAACVEEIGTTMDADFLPCGDEERWLKFMKQKQHHSTRNIPRWFDYLTKRNFSLKDNYPHLKRLTITLGEILMTAGTEDLHSICGFIGRNIRGLQSVHIVGLNDENMVSALTPMIERARTSPGDRRNVQTHTTELQTKVGWKNVTIWWGPSSGNPPYHTTTSETDLQWRRRLFRIGDGPKFTYTVGTSCVPIGPR